MAPGEGGRGRTEPFLCQLVLFYYLPEEKLSKSVFQQVDGLIYTGDPLVYPALPPPPPPRLPRCFAARGASRQTRPFLIRITIRLGAQN